MQASSISAYLTTPAGFVIGFALLWCGLCYLIRAEQNQ
jgi:hypothetical protein